MLRINLLLILLGVLVSIGTYTLVNAGRSGPIEQPIAFSHLQHVKNPNHPKLSIHCVFCHENVEKGSAAGLPSVTTCMPCHTVIKTDSSGVEALKAYFDRNEEIPWVPIARLPSYNRFSHKWHVRSGIDCATCHGDVGSSDVTTQSQEFTMGYCYSCHVSHRASVDCLTCHK